MPAIDLPPQAARACGAGLTAVRRLCTVPGMATRKAEKDVEPVDFASAMRDLEEIVERLEQGDLPLEESLAAFERGVLLTRSCQSALKEAEQKVEILLKKAGAPTVADFEPEEPAEPAEPAAD